MEKDGPRYGQPSDRGRPKNRTEQSRSGVCVSLTSSLRRARLIKYYARQADNADAGGDKGRAPRSGGDRRTRYLRALRRD